MNVVILFLNSSENLGKINKLWRGVRVAEGGSLENCCTSFPCAEGSNPSLSAKKRWQLE